LQQVYAIPEPGDVIGGKYRVERALGSGGMGAVFEVSHVITNKRFALKWLLADVNSGVAITRFIREAKVAGRFQHRNIVEVYDIDKEVNSFFMVMELLYGQSLAERLSQEGRMVAREACRILVPCMHAIGAAHAAGIIHRDIKPANIFLCAARGGEPEVPKMLDFGVASFASAQGEADLAHTRSGALVGTPFYMAPEQMRGIAIDQRVDIYALGVTLYEVLSCQRPFQADSYGDLVLKVTTEQPQPLEQLVSDLPRGLAAIVNRAMAREPEARYASTDELIRALEPYRDNNIQARIGFDTIVQVPHALAETPLFSETLSSLPPPRRAWRRRAPLLLGALGLLLAAAWLLVRGRDREPVVSPSRPTTAAQAPEAHDPATPPVQPTEPVEAPQSPQPSAAPEPTRSARRFQPQAPESAERPRRRRAARDAEDPDERMTNKPQREKARATVELNRSDF
jgi:eukaryotic-like serine/threonine-protein kinase